MKKLEIKIEKITEKLIKVNHSIITIEDDGSITNGDELLPEELQAARNFIEKLKSNIHIKSSIL